MAVKQVTMPITMKTNSFEAQFIANGHPESVARHEARRQQFIQQIEEAEAELNGLLNDGYTLVTQYEVETQQATSLTFLLHKKDASA